jgi:hypothetical protein
MGRTTRVIGGASIVLAPLVIAVADELRMVAEGWSTAGLVNTEYGTETVLRDLAAIEQNQGLFTLSATLSYAAVPLAVAALLAIWRLSVGRSPRWAWAGALLAGAGALGTMVHILGYHGLSLVALDVPDRAAAAEVMVAAESTPFVIALFTPFFLTLICPLPQAVGLFRARVVPLWACLSIAVGTVLFAVLGSTPWSTALWAVLVIAGFTPAARAMLRSGAAGPAGDQRVAQPATAAS